MADDEKPAAAEPYKLQFHYIKGPAYRETACHGVVGGPTPQGKVWMALFSERGPLPRMTEYHVTSPSDAGEISFNERSAGPPNYVETRQGVIRNVEFSAYLDVETAERLAQWLSEQVALLKREEKK
jgi:hypothetical protein